MPAEPLPGAPIQGLPPLLVEAHGTDETRLQRIAVAGEMDMLSAPAVHEAVVDVLKRLRPRRIEIDLSRVSFLDSEGIRTLLICHAEARRVDCPLTLVNPRQTVYRVLELTGVLDHFSIIETDP